MKIATLLALAGLAAHQVSGKPFTDGPFLADLPLDLFEEMDEDIVDPFKLPFNVDPFMADDKPPFNVVDPFMTENKPPFNVIDPLMTDNKPLFNVVDPFMADHKPPFNVVDPFSPVEELDEEDLEEDKPAFSQFDELEEEELDPFNGPPTIGPLM